jgi:hypothetical protein
MAQKYTLKTFGSKLYTWSPVPISKPKATTNGGNQTPYYCNALPYSQGQDWVTTYCYNLVVVMGIQERLAYVECDYVQ